MGKGTTQTDESFQGFADVVGAWGFVILKTPLSNPLLKGEGTSLHIELLQFTMKAPSSYGGD